MTDYLTADWHIGHNNILSYSDRPHGTLEIMEEEFIENTNACVGKGDRLFIIGDLFFNNTPINVMRRVLSALNGQKFLITGNHDFVSKWHKDVVEQFCWVREQKVIAFKGKTLPNIKRIGRDGTAQDIPLRAHLFHMPLADWAARWKGGLHFYGHVHAQAADADVYDPAVHTNVHIPGSLDVGIDNAARLLGSYRPFSLDEAVAYAKPAEFATWLRSTKPL